MYEISKKIARFYVNYGRTDLAEEFMYKALIITTEMTDDFGLLVDGDEISVVYFYGQEE